MTNAIQAAPVTEAVHDLWTIREAAAWLRMSVEAVRCRLKRAHFPKETYTHVGYAVRFIVPRLKHWVMNQGG